MYEKPRMYGDDTILKMWTDTPQVKINSGLNIIQSLLKVNKLTLNVKKIKYALIGSRPKLDLVPGNFTVKVNNISLNENLSVVCGDIYRERIIRNTGNSEIELLELWLPQIVKRDLKIYWMNWAGKY